MPTLGEINDTIRAKADTMSDAEIAQRIAAQSPDQAESSLRAIDSAYRLAGGFNYEERDGELVAITPVGELLEKFAARLPITAAEIEPVIAWIRSNPAPALPSQFTIVKANGITPDFSSLDWQNAVLNWPIEKAMAVLDEALTALVERAVEDSSKRPKQFRLARNAFITKAAIDYGKPAYRRYYQAALHV